MRLGRLGGHFIRGMFEQWSIWKEVGWGKRGGLVGGEGVRVGSRLIDSRVVCLVNPLQSGSMRRGT